MNQHENSTRTVTDSAARLPVTLRLGAIHLTVSDLDRSIAFYESAIGLKVHRRDTGITTEEREGGLLVRDPWGIAVLFVAPEVPTA